MKKVPVEPFQKFDTKDIDKYTLNYIDKGVLMKFNSKDCRKVLREKRENEKFWDAARRIFPEKFDFPSDWNPKAIRIRRKSNKAAIRKSFVSKSHIPKCYTCWKKIVREVFQKMGRRCMVCDSRENLSVHHIIPVSERGPTEIWNMLPLCEPCHDFIECHEAKPRTIEDCLRIGFLRLEGI